MEQQDPIAEIVDRFEHRQRHLRRPKAGDLNGSRTQVRGTILRFAHDLPPRRWRARLALGALGYWWLTLAEPLLGRRLWLPAPAGSPARTVWESSLAAAAGHVVGPALSLGVLLGAVLWALAALSLPWIVRGRSALSDLIAAAAWSAAIAVATPALDAGLPAAGAYAAPRGAILGAILGCVIALAARALRGPV